MADMDERSQRIVTLQTWFHVSQPDGPFDEAGLQSFLDEINMAVDYLEFTQVSDSILEVLRGASNLPVIHTNW